MKKVITTLFFVCMGLFVFAQYGIYQMIVYYPVDRTVSGDTIYDISGHKTHGIMHNVSLTTDRFGNENSAISFNGNDSYISMSCPYFSEPEYCYSLWAKIYQNPYYGESQTVLSIGTDYGVDHFLMNTNHYSLNDHLGWLGGGYHTDQTHAVVRTQTESLENKWVQITYFRNSDILKIFINGELIATSDENVQTPYFGDDFVGNIGRRVNGTQYFYGALDDIRIYEQILDTGDVSAIYQQEEIPIPLVIAGNDLIISPSTTDIQINGETRLNKTLNWTTCGDGYFSDPAIENPTYFPGISDLNSGETSLVLTCTGYNEGESVVIDTLRLLNPTLVFDIYPFNMNLSVFPNPISNDKTLNIKSNTFNLSSIQEVKLVNTFGQVFLAQRARSNAGNSLSISCCTLPSGVYFLVLDEIKTGQKIIIN